MDPELRRQALACIDRCLEEVQVVIVAFTRELAYKIAEQFNEDSGEPECLPCINDRRFDEHINELNNSRYRIVAGTVGRIESLFYRNVLRPPFIKELYILDSAAMVFYPLKRSLERLLGFMQPHIHITLHLPPCELIVRQIHDFIGNVSCYEEYSGLAEANHFAVHVADEMRKMDTLCELCQMNASVPILVCCASRPTVFANAKILRAKNIPVVTLTRNLKSDDTRVAIDTFQSQQVKVMITTGYIRGLIDLRTPTVIINYDLPKPDAYARRINFTGDLWIARHTVFISLIKMAERRKLQNLKEKLSLRWILETYSN